MLFFRSLILFLFLGVLAQQVPAQLQEKGTKNTCERRFLVGLNNFEPFAYRENGRLQGLAHDLIVIIKDKMGCQFIESELPRPSAVDQINHGRVDVLALMVRSSEYETGGNFIPFYNSQRELTVAKKVFARGKKIEDYLNDEKIKFAYMIGNRSVISESEETRLLKASRLVGVPTPDNAFRLLKEGRVQAVLFSALVTSYHTKKQKMEDQVEKVVDLSKKVQVGLYLSKRRVSAAEKQSFEKALDEMKKDGSFLRVFSKYMSEEEALHRLQN
ncbi:substrate-binding periplasmic protein [Bdellovibrio sp. BCCA]|uniref:substrate-binding periplasmic protein n=1 Tax=Bdellovibrio sp. BCCA TaxID=3136281 RepID=UPI0030F15C39